MSFEELLWPLSRLGEALTMSARRIRGGALGSLETLHPPEDLRDEDLERWIDLACTRCGLETEAVEVSLSSAAEIVEQGGPAILWLPETDRFLVMVVRSWGRPVLMAPDLKLHRLSSDTVVAALSAPLAGNNGPRLDDLLAEAGVPVSRQRTASRALLGYWQGSTRIGTAWLLQLPPGTAFSRQLQQAGLHLPLLALTFGHILQYLLWLASWWVIGRGALQGRLDPGWLAAWALLLLTLVPLTMLRDRSQGLFAIGTAALLKRRLLEGGFRLHPDLIRRQGVGHLLGRVIESDAIATLGLSGALLALFSVIELGIAGWVLSAGAGGGLHLAMLALMLGLLALLVVRYQHQRRRWAETRLSMTHDLVERMAGHRTRLAQEPSELWHRGEDEALANYLDHSVDMDRSAVAMAVAPRAWLVIGLAGLAPGLLGGSSSAALAVGLGGVLLVQQALGRLTNGLAQLSDVVISWSQVAPLFHAAAGAGCEEQDPLAISARNDASPADTILEARDLRLSYPDRAEPVLRGSSLRIRSRDRLLLEGPSGCGKSSLAALFAGLRQPTSGLLLLGGLDRRSLGSEGWRRRVAAAPQFHENHVFAETLAFNLLMGRRWPPEPEDLRAARKLCQELGLSSLLERMPGGLFQMVGETGWQLSHGERSRLFVARALLQGSDLVVLDESFGALDPENLHQALSTVLDQAPALLVIAHP